MGSFSTLFEEQCGQNCIFSYTHDDVFFNFVCVCVCVCVWLPDLGISRKEKSGGAGRFFFFFKPYPTDISRL